MRPIASSAEFTLDQLASDAHFRGFIEVMAGSLAAGSNLPMPHADPEFWRDAEVIGYVRKSLVLDEADRISEVKQRDAIDGPTESDKAAERVRDMITTLKARLMP